MLAAFQTGTRSPDGKPGPNYWQNRSVHDITINVAPPSRTISATETITYTNNSPNALPQLVFRVYQNVHQPDARRDEPKPLDSLNAGVQIDAFSVNGQAIDLNTYPLFAQTGTTYYGLNLAGAELQPGASMKLSFTWHYDLAPAAGWKEGAVDDTSYFLAYFYPRVAMLNDVPAGIDGWDIEQHMALSGREMANEFADYTFSVNVPKNFVVWATGELQNPDEVLQPTYAQRLASSLTGDAISIIATPEETQQGLVTAQTDTVTWKWKAENVTDIALGLSDHYTWDAGSVVVDPATGRRASVQAAYPVEATTFTDMVQHGKDALAFGSTAWPGVPYPYSKSTIFMGGADEEYPMMANDAAEGPADVGVRFVAAHEVLHSWFPFFMGTDERRYPFMDEGWTTAFEYLFNEQDLGVEQADKIFINFRSSYLNKVPYGGDLPIIFPAEWSRGAVTGRNAYEKAALGFLALKDLMGEEAFKGALQEFIARWNGKHPLPWDMFNTFNDVSGQSYSWFFNSWYTQPHYIDLTVGGVQKADASYAVQVQNVGGMPIPFDVNVVYADGTSETLHQSPAIWQASPSAATVQIAGDKEPKEVTLDGGIFVDATPDNNSWTSK
ncbi:MAG: M1 family metallopeptidase [Chloroflexales bacterium]|nr:M1 family metallopeptidase [Chloroflexales bacterium]